MYPVSKLYQSVMRLPVRQNQAHATVFLGVFDGTASSDATLVAPEQLPYSDADSLLEDGASVESSYATFETNGFRLDGSQLLLPDSLAQTRSQAFIGELLSGPSGVFSTEQTITFTFGVPHSMIGLTLTFDPYFAIPSQVRIEGYLDGALVAQATTSPTASPTAQIQVALADVDEIKLTALSMPQQGQRFRLNGIGFGLGYKYSDSDFIQLTDKHQESPVSLTLPTSSLEFTLFNLRNRFGVNSETELQQFLAQGQPVQVDYSVDLPNASPQAIPGRTWQLNSWAVEGIEARFSAVGPIERLTTTTYQKGVFDGQPHSLQSLAEAVFSDAGVEPENYYIDPFLATVSTSAPLPIVTHAEALQLIANAGLARLFEDRAGRICLETTVASAPVFSSDTAQTAYSNPQSLSETDNAEYATFEPGFFRVDGSQMLLPGAAPYLSAGWVGAEASSGEQYPENEVLLTYEYPTNVYTLDIDWGGSVPTAAQASALIDGAWGAPIGLNPSRAVETYAVSFVHCTALRISLVGAPSAGVRPRIKAVNASMLSDFVLTPDQIFENPVGTLGPKLRNVTTTWISRTVGQSSGSIVQQEVPTNAGWVAVSHALVVNPQISLTVGGEPATGITVEAQHFAYVSLIQLTSSSDQTVVVEITGNPVSEVEFSVSSTANPTGEDMPIQNPLFASASMAQSVADWVRDYYTQRVTYNNSIRGFPELDCGDTIYLENGNPAVITENTLTYNGAFNSDLTLRG